MWANVVCTDALWEDHFSGKNGTGVTDRLSLSWFDTSHAKMLDFFVEQDGLNQGRNGIYTPECHNRRTEKQ